MRVYCVFALLACLANGADQGERKILFWYDPMYPNTKFDAPGPSPFMDMDLVPKYADEGEREGFTISAAQRQNLGLKTAAVAYRALDFSQRFPAVLEFNEYQKAVVQHRASGFVEKAYPLAIGDYVKKGDKLCDITVVEWTEAQSEYIVTQSQTALNRLRLAGMSDEEIEKLKKRRTIKTRFVLRSPIDGVLSEFNMREGMNFEKSSVAAVIDGIDPIWIVAFIPEKLARRIENAKFSAIIDDKEYALNNAKLLPSVNLATKTATLRAELPNADRKLRPNANAIVKASIFSEPLPTIPSQAVIDDGVLPRAIVVDSEGYFTPKAVKIIAESNGLTAIEGLKEGENVVETGLFLIDSEANINGALDRLKRYD
ncbi:MAG: efflux RND transporter periplasmic adaptor subunit [Helicobacteraceae bacterium]|jgi:Cu(I)/Ag(I) efflux system membrane fusion protein|nr:efflux RND transporter periplasmic adaptor subunit [Helicobacteraceae bacterium]